jgi:hypothetical protein
MTLKMTILVNLALRMLLALLNSPNWQIFPTGAATAAAT